MTAVVWVGINLGADSEDNSGVRVGVGETTGNAVAAGTGDRESIGSSGARCADLSVAVRKVPCPMAATSEVADGVGGVSVDVAVGGRPILPATISDARGGLTPISAVLSSSDPLVIKSL